MPWLTKQYLNYANKTSLSERLQQQSKVMLKSNILLWPLSKLTWILFLACALATPYFLDTYANVQYTSNLSVAITLSALALICTVHTIYNKQKGLTTTVTKDAIDLPLQYINNGSLNYIQMSRIKTIHIQRFFYHYQYTKPGKVLKSVAKVEIYTHVCFSLNTGENINLSRTNIPAVPELVEYITQHYSPQLTYAYPTPLKLLGLGIVLFFGIKLSLIISGTP